MVATEIVKELYIDRLKAFAEIKVNINWLLRLGKAWCQLQPTDNHEIVFNPTLKIASFFFAKRNVLNAVSCIDDSVVAKRWKTRDNYFASLLSSSGTFPCSILVSFENPDPINTLRLNDRGHVTAARFCKYIFHSTVCEGKECLTKCWT